MLRKVERLYPALFAGESESFGHIVDTNDSTGTLECCKLGDTLANWTKTLKSIHVYCKMKYWTWDPRLAHPDTDYVTLLDASIHDTMIARSEDIREIKHLLTRNVIGDLEEVNISFGDANIFCLAASKPACEMRIPEETGIAVTIHIILKSSIRRFYQWLGVVVV